MTEFIPCHVPANTKPKSPVFENFRGSMKLPVSLDDLTWLIVRYLQCSAVTGTDIEEVTSEMPERCSKIEQNIHTALAPEWSTLLTVLKQAQHINTIVLGPNRKTVITLDMHLISLLCVFLVHFTSLYRYQVPKQPVDVAIYHRNFVGLLVFLLCSSLYLYSHKFTGVTSKTTVCYD